MKIAIILISEGWSGAEKVVYNLISRIKETNSITIFINEEMKKYYSNIKKIKIISLGHFIKQSKLSRFFCLLRMKSKLKHVLDKFEVINPHMELSEFVCQPSSKIIPVLHGSDVKGFLCSRKLYYLFFIKPTIKKGFNFSKKIISVSHHQIAEFPSQYKKKTIVIPNGVDSNIFKPIKSIKQKKNVILFTGRFIDIKGIKEILAVAKQLPQYEFWFAGQGPLANEIKGKNIKNLGFKTTVELIGLYNQAKICIFPSHIEAFSLVGLEAMSCGRAVIATPLGFSEYIENGKDGIIIPAKDEKALKDAIVDLMENPAKRKKLEKNARKKALKYSWDKVAKQYLKVFKEVVKENKK